MMNVRISEDALQDLQEGFWFFEAQQAGLGGHFLTSVRTDIEGLKISAGIHRVVYRDYHRLLCRIFPFGIFYTVGVDCAVIWAVVDLRRDPEWLRKKFAD